MRRRVAPKGRGRLNSFEESVSGLDGRWELGEGVVVERPHVPEGKGRDHREAHHCQGLDPIGGGEDRFPRGGRREIAAQVAAEAQDLQENYGISALHRLN